MDAEMEEEWLEEFKESRSCQQSALARIGNGTCQAQMH
jgi:hypothetical protein